MVTSWRKKHLGLVLETPERFAVNDAIAISLKRRSNGVLGLWTDPAAAVGTLGRLRREDVPFPLFELFSNEHYLVLGGALRALASGASLGPQALSYDRAFLPRITTSRKLFPCFKGPTPKRSAIV
jgi:hypothetical protein